MPELEEIIQDIGPLKVLEQLEKNCKSCTECELHEGRKNVVFGEGKADRPDFMFVGEGPGYNEDQTGRPFVGPAGELLNKMIEAMGYKREDVYIANIVKCRPPSNRVPTQHEREQCISWLGNQINLIQPRFIIGLGNTSWIGLVNETHDPGLGHRFGDVRGRVTYYQATRSDFTGLVNIPMLFTYHPAYLLRNESAKTATWADLQIAMSRLNEIKTLELAASQGNPS